MGGWEGGWVGAWVGGLVCVCVCARACMQAGRQPGRDHVLYGEPVTYREHVWIHVCMYTYCAFMRAFMRALTPHDAVIFVTPFPPSVRDLFSLT